MSFLVPIHVLAIVIWVGGMFFAYVVLRPVAAAKLEPPARLTLWAGVFAGFFPWVWVCIAGVLGSGLWMMFKVFGGFAAPVYIHAMFGLGIVMMLIFMHVFSAPYQRLKKAVAAEDWPEGGRQLAQVRRLVGINTIIGVITIVTATAGRYLVG